MSLVTMTFGSDFYRKKRFSGVDVTRPGDLLGNNEAGKIEVKKVNQFFGERNIYIVVEVKSGVLFENMKAKLGNKTCYLVEIESKYGRTAKKGMNAGLTVAGIDKDEIQKGQILEFTA